MSGEDSRASRWWPRLVLLVSAAAAVLWLARLDYSHKVSTNVTDLLPADEREPEVQLLRRLVDDAQGRSLWFVLTGPDGETPPEESVTAFADALQSGDAVPSVIRVDRGDGPRELAAHVFAHRLTLLLPAWLETRQAEFAGTGQPAETWPGWLANRTAGELDAFLARPESAALDELLPADPLLLLNEVAGQAAVLGAMPAATATSPALLWAQSRAGPLSEAGQEPVFARVAAATAAAQELAPGLSVRWTGVHRFAAASKARIKAEFSWLNSVAVVVVLLATALLIRRPWRVLHLLPVVLLALLGAWTVTTLLFERIHILVFVLGALLTGAAIDYGFHVSVHQDRTAPPGFARLRPVIKPLVGSCFTTVIGFSLLWWSELPLLRQLGVFVTAGLLSALGAALLYFSQVASAPIEPRQSGTRRVPRWVGRTAVGLALLAAVGLARLTWHDDIRELEVPTPYLQDNDRAVRRWFGDQAGRTAWLVRGRDLAEARERLQALVRWQEDRSEAALASAGLVWPTLRQYVQAPTRLGTLADFPDQFQAALAERGYAVEDFAPFFAAWQQRTEQAWPEYEQVVAEILARLQGPLSHLAGRGDGQAWLVAFSAEAPTELPPAELEVVELNQLQTLNRVFTRYRAHAAQLSLVGLAVVVGSVLLLYGGRRGLRILLIPLAACAISFGVLGWLGHPLNLFHLLAAFLGLCLSHDYAIFATEPRGAGQPPPASIRLAALTTAASFGVLGFSRIPVISALGITVTLIVLVALAMVELGGARQLRSHD